VSVRQRTCAGTRCFLSVNPGDRSLEMRIRCKRS
jgi:hypothetical protein